jgi:hypothetical protein
MKQTMATKFAVPVAVLALGLLGAAPVGAQTTTVPEVATLTVTKTVVGTPPAGTTFTLHISCAGDSEQVEGMSGQAVDYDQDIPFTAAGGSVDFVFTGPSACEITETDDGGATSSSGSVEVAILEPIDYAAEITNTFADPATTAPAAEAAAVEAAPAFTG